MSDREKKSRKRKKIIFIVLSVCLAGLLSFFVLCRSISRSIVDEKHTLLVEKGTTYDVLLDSLRSGNKVTNIGIFERFASLMKLGDTIKFGRYELRPGMNARQVVGMFRSGSQSPVRVTFTSLRTLEDLAGRLGERLYADSADFLAAMTDDDTARRFGFEPEEFIAMFIPNTYEFYWTVTPEGFLNRMHREYERFWEGERDDKLTRSGLTRTGAATLASIVEEETAVSDEMPTIAGVYINRLKKDMLLQADPTVKYAAGNMSLRRVLNKHLEIDSQYNTYIYKGLPPGPIRIPSVQAVEAVLDYQQSDYLFFCAKSDFSGRHAFAKTLAEHNRNAQAYYKALNAAGIR